MHTGIPLALLLTAGAMTGCQSYSPRPLDSAAQMMDAWATRLPDGDEVRAFAAALGRSDARAGELFCPEDGLSLWEAEIVALCFNPTLREIRAEAAVALASWEHAGALDDPVLELSVLRVLENVPSRWIIGGTIGFTLPLTGRRDVERARAGAAHVLALERVREAEWRIRHDVRALWIDWSASGLAADLAGGMVDRLLDVQRLADRAAAAGEISRAEARLVRMERLSRDHERALLRVDHARAEAGLRAVLGLRPDAAVRLEPQVSPPGGWLPGAGSATADPAADAALLAERHPALALLRAAHAESEHRLHLEVLRQYPDLTFGPSVERDQGAWQAGPVLSLPIPIFSGNRRGIAEARAARDAAQAAFESMHQRLVGEAAMTRAECAALAEARSALEAELIPLMDAQLEEERRLIALGERSAIVIVEALARSHDLRRQLIDLSRRESLAAARLSALLGDDQESGLMERDS